VITLDDPQVCQEVAAMPAEVPSAPAAPGQLAYVIYTSGSTGVPKGVQATHGGLVNLAVALRAMSGAGAGVRVLQFASFSFDAAVRDVAVVLSAGGTLVVATAAQRAEPGLLGRMIRGGGVEAAALAPSLLGVLDPGDLRGVSTLFAGSERVSAQVAAVWGPGRRLFNAYGPTETTVISSTAPVDPGSGVAPPIGSPVANTRVFVVDRWLNVVPAGVAGELLIGGAGVARGYGGRAALTAGRFVADWFAGDGSRLYRSGDRVRWRADGVLEFLGRFDDQVKVRGFRVEPGEVEAVLAAHRGVRAAVVTVAGDAQDGRLVAYLVPADQSAGMPPAGELRSFAAARLPEFMVPSVFTELASLPLTPSGKLDRGALPAPDAARPGLAGGYVAPSSPAQELLAGVWAQVLGLERVGVHDSFFELGGHSLLATQVVSRVRGVFGAEVALAALFDHPTVAGLAAVIEAGAGGLAGPPVTPVGRGGWLPLSFAQQRLWFIDQLEPGSVEYNVPMPVRLGRVDVAALGAALSGVVARHEVLRTRLVTGPGGVAGQVIDPPGGFWLAVADVSGAGDPAGAAQRLVAADAVAGFDLAGGPLLRAVLVRVGAGEHVLVLAAHHVVTDEWSMGILRRELVALYQAFGRGEADPLPPLGVQYADYAVWQREWLAGEVLAGQLGYWRGQLAGLPVLELPADRPRPAVRSSAGAAVEFTVPAAAAAGLRRVARDGGATMFMTVLAGFCVLLGRYCGVDDVVAGTPVAGRNRAETEDLIGFFVNTLVMRADLSGDPDFTGLLARVRQMALGAYAHQDLPFEQLVEALVTERDRSRTPLFQVLFSYAAGGRQDTSTSTSAGAQSGPPAEDAPPGPAGGVQPGPAGGVQPGPLPVKFDLAVLLGEGGGGGLSGVIQYSAALFDAARVQRMAGHLGVLLEAVAADAGQRLSGVGVLTAAERDLLAGWNDTAAPVPGGGVHELVAVRAAERADAVAVAWGDSVLTYAGLVVRAGRLAQYLRGLGVGAETIVGLCLDRGPQMITAMLAVWQAGGAFLPLDPGYPAQRLAFMVADSRAGVLVTQRGHATALPADLSGAWPAGRVRVITLDDPQVCQEVAAMPAEVPSAPAAPGQLAYVIYTSGSTGVPKGVQVTHGGLVNYVAWAAGAYGMDGGLGAPLHSSLAFDLTVTSVLVPLAAGSAVVASREGGAEGLAAVLRNGSGFGLVKVVPGHLPVLAELVPGGSLAGVARRLIVGGEALSGAHVRSWLASAPQSVVVNEYGPTETVVGCCVFEVAAGQEIPEMVPIGTPIANTRLHVLDRQLSPVPAGVEGELFIAGAGVARGYGERPALTAGWFVADPFAADGSRLYRSGDRARWRADGQLEFLGRADDQVKVRGFRVEPGEVEAVLAAHPAVRAAVVTVAGDAQDGRLVAYLVPASADAAIPPAGELRAYLQQRLPEFMVPAVFTELASLPLTPSGKLDRAALPAPDAARPELAGGYVAPVTPAEELLAGIWAQVLGLDRVGVHDNFFELGGHSLLVIQIVARIRASGYHISVGDFFDHPTIALAAPLIRAQADDPEIRSAVRIRGGTVVPAIFCVHPVGGGVTEFAELAGYLGEGQQFYGLQSRGLVGEDRPLESVKEMAAAYLNEVLRLQPDGPYLFASWSMGGYIAVEMARQAVAMGKEMSAVLLIGPPIQTFRRILDRDIRKLLRHLDDTVSGGPGKRLLPAYEEQLLQLGELDEDVITSLREGNKPRLRAARIALTNMLAGIHYRDLMNREEEQYDGRVVMFIPRDGKTEGRRQILEQWRSSLRLEPEVVDVPGQHKMLVHNEGAATIGARLAGEINRWQRPEAMR
jgi:amino acid adenylation domain-containing protein